MSSIPISPLPIDDAIPALRHALRNALRVAQRDHGERISGQPNRTNVVLHAPPGAGKTTRVPLALLDEPWLEGQRILMLEPRRLATRAAAQRMAYTLGENVGETVGYRIRMESRISARTRIEVVTEGILTRMLHDDPTLEGVGLVIFDEFHERSVHADLGLALTLNTQRVIRDDLRILVMSATLDTGAVARLLGEDGQPAPIVSSEGRSFPVALHYRARPAELRVEGATVSAVRHALAHDTGDVLVFLPGAGEIRRVDRMLNEAGVPPNVAVMPLFGALSQDAQDAAIAPSRGEARKVVLATSIAETSLTIEGVHVVIDAGLMRVPRFSPRSGMTRLDTIRVTHASAEQRRGRAGRLGPGICYRLWGESEQAQLLAHGTPEILETDLAPLTLELAAAGIADPNALTWIDIPPSAAVAHARELLTQLGALDGEGRITPHGERMAGLPVHPRIAHMLLMAAPLGFARVACEIAALLNERDIVYADGGAIDADLRIRLDALRGNADSVLGYRIDRGVRQRVRSEASDLRRQLTRAVNDISAQPERAADDVDAVGLVLAFAYPDRIAQRRAQSNGRFLLRNGRGAAFPFPQTLSKSEYVVVADLDGQAGESRIFLAAPVTLDELEAHLTDSINVESVIEWDSETRAVRARTRERFGALILADAPLRDPDSNAVAHALIDGIAREGLRALPWSDGARQLQARILFLRHRDDSWPDVSDVHLLATMHEWLAPSLTGITKLDQLTQRIDMHELLLAMLSWEQRSALDRRAPSHYVAPTGSRLPIDYGNPDAPILGVRLQEMFGVANTPTVDRGAVTLTLHLLSPAHRPVQVTRDLAGFWRTSYFDVRKDLKGRYPKHSWPDDPLAATATRYTKARTP